MYAFIVKHMYRNCKCFSGDQVNFAVIIQMTAAKNSQTPIVRVRFSAVSFPRASFLVHDRGARIISAPVSSITI